MLLKKTKKKPIKLLYYLRAIRNRYMPLFLHKKRSFNRYNSLSFAEKRELFNRVNYYMKLKSFSVDDCVRSLREVLEFRSSTYYLDTVEYLRCFPCQNRLNTQFGDVTKVPETATLVKSRPISAENQNSILLKLNKHRHFLFVHDNERFENKIPKAVWRGAVHQPNRIEFVKKLNQNKNSNVGGYTKRKRNKPWEKEFMSLPELLQYRYQLCIEGNDVATNLKWGMSSNSLCLMTKPKYETWFMEGTLVPGIHYVKLKDDYSDLDDVIEYYNTHPAEALEIIRQAHEHVDQFRNKYTEDLVSYMVLRKYFKNSGQSWH